MHSVLLSVLACVGDKLEDPAANTQQDADEHDSSEPFDPGDATLTLELENYAFSVPLPVQVYRTDETLGERRLVGVGTTETPIEVGAGAVEPEVGPYVEPSASGANYYPTDDGYTEDGLPMVIASDRRYVLPPATITVDQEDERADANLVGVVGEGVYRCTWEKYALDEGAANKRGEHVTSLLSETGQEYVQGRIAFAGGRYLMPDPASPLADFGGILNPNDALVITLTPDGVYKSNIALESAVDNEILAGSTVKGAGLNNFDVDYVDRSLDFTYSLSCLYDWSDFTSSY